MATIITETVKPSGGDYTLLSTAVAAIPASLIASDEQWNIEVDEKSGGYADSVTMPTITSDATRYPEIRAAAGHEYIPHLDTGAFLTASVGFAGVFTNGASSFLRLKNIGFKNTRTATSGRCIDWFGNNGTIEGVYGTTASTSGAIVFFMNNANDLNISECLSCLGTTGFDFGNNSVRTANKLTSVDAIDVGIDTGTANTTIVDSFSFGSTDPWLGTFNVASSNNASDGVDAPGSGSLQNRTSADFANYAGNDFRTASASALATAGTVDFIGFALEVSAGISITPDAILSSQTLSEPTLTQNNSLSVNNIISANTVSESVLSQQGELSVNPVLSAQTISEPVFTQANVLSVNNITTANTISEVALVIAGALGVDDLSSSQSITLTSFVQQNLLDVDDLSNAQTISQSVIDTGLNLIVQDISSAQSISESGFTQHNIILVDPITNAQFIGVVNISGDGQDIGTVTASFKEDDISVKYGILNITVQFKE